MATTFKLSNKDRETLLKWGHREHDLKQIEDSANAGEFFNNKGHLITWGTALRTIGKREFLSGISRAAFHWTAGRENLKTGKYVSFDFSKYLNGQ